MRRFKQAACLILCFVLTLPLFGCGQASTAPTQTAAEPTEVTENPVDSYLASAQSFLDQEDYDAATALLEQAKEISEDGRIEEMLLQIEELRSTPLNVLFRVDSSNLKSGTVEVHSVTAFRRPDGIVKFVIDYTATEGMYFLVGDAKLGSTTGTRDIFSFEMPAADLPSTDEKILVTIAQSPSDMCVMECMVTDPPAVPAQELGYSVFNDAFDGGYQISSCTGEILHNGIVHYKIAYSAVEGVSVDLGLNNYDDDGFESPQSCTIFGADGAASGTADILIPLEDAQACDAVLVLLLSPHFGETEDFYDVCYGINIPNDWLSLTDGMPLGEAVELPSFVGEIRGEAPYTFHSCTAQPLDNGYIRFSIDYTAPEHLSGAFTYYLAPHDNHSLDKVLYFASGREGRQSVALDIPADEITPDGLMSFVMWDPWSQEDNVIVVAIEAAPVLPANRLTVTEGTPSGEAVELFSKVCHNDNKAQYAFHGCTAQPLDNGYIRFAMDYTAPEHQLGRFTYNDKQNPVQEAAFVSTQTGRQSIVMDIPANDIRPDVFFSVAEHGLGMYVAINAAPVMGG